MEFRELCGEQWEFVKPHLSSQPITGRKRDDDFIVINSVLLCPVTAVGGDLVLYLYCQLP